MLIGTAWTSRVGPDTAYLAGIAVPMVIFGVGQGLGLSALTTGGMASVAATDAGVAGGLVNVAHHLGGAVGLGILVTDRLRRNRRRGGRTARPARPSRLGRVGPPPRGSSCWRCW
jgi:hypothetical protein